jgi:hypothetical protein
MASPTGTSRILPGGLDRVALGDVQVVAQHHRADRVLLEVQREPEGVARELEHLAVGRVGEAVDAHDAVRHRDHRADVTGDRRGLELEDLLFDQVADFRCLDGHFQNPLVRDGAGKPFQAAEQ